MKHLSTLILITLFFLITHVVTAQVYIEKQTRHRFAQMNLGVDFSMHLAGESSYISPSGDIKTLNIGNGFSPRILIGGTHFWGHADFVIAIPVYSQSQEAVNQSISFYRGVETIFKYYPWRITDKKALPYIGTSLAPFTYTQDNNNVEFGSGADLNTTRLPLIAGITYNSKNHIFTAGLSYNYANKVEYYIDQSTTVKVSTPPVSFSLGYKYMLETTLGAEKSWESGKTKEITEKLGSKLDAFFVGVGLSSAWWLGRSSYNHENHPFIPAYGTSMMADFTTGYYFHKPDMDVSMNYRGYSGSASVYGVAQSARRRSLGVEVKKYLFDYNGFVPFVGPAVSYENLTFAERVNNGDVNRWEDNKLAYGITFGWDIRPNRVQGFLLRTNLRYFPGLNLDNVNGGVVDFDAIEFNFIQLVIFPERMF